MITIHTKTPMGKKPELGNFTSPLTILLFFGLHENAIP